MPDRKLILVIEDDILINANVVALLAYEGFETASALNGLEAIKKAHIDRPDLILCDIVMPVMNGYSVLAHIRDNPATATIPFAFLTGRGDDTQIHTGMALGADDYLTKPFDAQELLALVHNLLENKPGRVG